MTTINPTVTPSETPSASPDVTLPSAGFTYTSSNTGVVKVSNSGVITPQTNDGNATVTVTYTDANGNQTSKSTSVYVYTKLKSLDILKSGSVCTGQTISITSNNSFQNIQLSPKYNSGNNYTVSSSYQGVTWTSSNQSVATVSTSGLVTPVANSEGTATITCKSSRDTTKSASITIKTSKVVKSIGGVESQYTIYTNAEPKSITLVPVINY